MPPRRVLILSAAIGEGHDLPARVLAEELEAEAPGTRARVVDSLEVMGWPLDLAIEGGSKMDTTWGSRVFDVEYWLLAQFPPTRWLCERLLYLIGGRGLMRLIREERPDAIVSTYPGVTVPLALLRQSGRLRVPVVSAITDLAALTHWAHPGVDLHLITHPESAAEVRLRAGPAAVEPVRGLNSPDFLVLPGAAEARRALDLPEGPKLVVVSGGGWGVGDLAGAIDAVLALEGTFAVALCGRNAELRESLDQGFGSEPRVRVLGFTDRMPELLRAADALVHSTAGLTVLEAIMCGCPAISYGWGRGHIRANNRAFARFGLAEVAAGRPELERKLRTVLEHRPEPDASFGRLPSAASLVLDLVERRNGA